MCVTLNYGVVKVAFNWIQRFWVGLGKQIFHGLYNRKLYNRSIGSINLKRIDTNWADLLNGFVEILRVSLWCWLSELVWDGNGVEHLVSFQVRKLLFFDGKRMQEWKPVVWPNLSEHFVFSIWGENEFKRVRGGVVCFWMVLKKSRHKWVMKVNSNFDSNKFLPPKGQKNLWILFGQWFSAFVLWSQHWTKKYAPVSKLTSSKVEFASQ